MSDVFKIVNETERDYYCSVKFRSLKIDLQASTVYNCHSAAPHKIDFKWLNDSQNQLFNDEINVFEREQMLRNERNKSCEQNCWFAEDIKGVSPRLNQAGQIKTHLQAVTNPEVIDITLGTDCNLTCSYCCKKFSTAWQRDLIDNGSYNLSNYDNERYQLTDFDKVSYRVSQPALKNSKNYQLLTRKIFDLLPGLLELEVTGGEPFLDNGFFDDLASHAVTTDLKITVYTGLKVSPTRLRSILSKLTKFKNLTIVISAEGIGKHLEFNRYGITWGEFLENVNIIKSNGIQVKFRSVVSALTIFGFVEFAKFFKDECIYLALAYQPRFASPHNLDSQSKDVIKQQILDLSDEWQQKILSSIDSSPAEQDRINLSEFLTQFVGRRPDLNYSIFPSHFLEWLKIDVV